MQGEKPVVSGLPKIRKIGFNDLSYALSSGIRDFARAPSYGLFIAGLFTIGGIIIFLQLTVWESSWLILPVAVGFPLIGPFVVVGLYEVSRILEIGETPDWNRVLGRILRHKDGQIPSIAFIVTFFFGIWFYMAHLVFALFFGLSAMTNISSSYEVLLSQQGITMLLVGSIVGGALAFVLFSISVLSFPLLMDREIDFVSAMIASFGAVGQNFAVMICWAAVIGILTVIAMIPAFLGLLLVLPVLGHASWHLYRRALEPA